MDRNNNTKRKTSRILVSPGSVLREELTERKISQKDFAAILEIAPSNLNAYITGKRSFTLAFSKKLEKALGIDRELWIGLQENYDLALSENAEELPLCAAGDAARKVIALTNVSLGDALSNLKLQKLLYYLQGFFLSQLGRPLFDEDMEAWNYGPVVPSVYHHYKIFGATSIPVPSNEQTVDLGEDGEALFQEVYSRFNRYSASALVEMTHAESPWQDHRPRRKGTRGGVIPKQELTRFFETYDED